MSDIDVPVTDIQRRLLIAEARQHLGLSADPSDGVGHGGLSRDDPGLGGAGGLGHGGVGRDGDGSFQAPDASAARALAERISRHIGRTLTGSCQVAAHKMSIRGRQRPPSARRATIAMLYFLPAGRDLAPGDPRVPRLVADLSLPFDAPKLDYSARESP